MRKKALKGFVALIVLLVVCFFFSGTIKTLTTPKVMTTYPKQGRLKENIPLTGFLTFSDTTSVTYADVPEGVSLTVTEVHVAPGMYVQAGDVLFETRLANADSLIATQEQNYSTAQTDLLALEKENNTLRMHRNDENWFSAYDALVAAYDTRHSAQITLEVEAKLQGVELIDGRLPEGITDDTLLLAQEAVDTAQRDVDVALTSMERADRVGVADAAYNYVMKRRTLESQMSVATQQIIALKALEKDCQQICAPNSGYIINVNVTAGQSWDGMSAALTMSAADATLLLRADASQTSRPVDEGASVTIVGRYGKEVKTTVSSVGYNSEGVLYADAILQQSDISVLDTPANLMKKGITLQINYTAANVTYMLPASAVRGSGNNRFVYTLTSKENSFGQTVLIVEEQKVTVLEESNDTVALTGLPGDKMIAYMEDRAISPGSEVMIYE